METSSGDPALRAYRDPRPDCPTAISTERPRRRSEDGATTGDDSEGREFWGWDVRSCSEATPTAGGLSPFGGGRVLLGWGAKWRGGRAAD